LIFKKKEAKHIFVIAFAFIKNRMQMHEC